MTNREYYFDRFSNTTMSPNEQDLTTAVTNAINWAKGVHIMAYKAYEHHHKCGDPDLAQYYKTIMDMMQNLLHILGNNENGPG